MRHFLKTALPALAIVAGMSVNAQAAEATGAGASFVYPAMSKWSSDYNRATNNKINYQSIGSGGGIAQIKAGTVSFGSTDAPLSPKELGQFKLAQFPSVIGGVVPVVNIPGVAAGAMKLDGELLADIYMGKVTQWNDPRILAQNGGVNLPDTKIIVVRRSDASGTTFNFVNYLSKVSPEWKSKVGEGTSVRWPVGIGGKGNEGVTGYVKQMRGAIGYVELSYAIQNKLAYARMKNADGQYVLPSEQSFQAAAANANWGASKDFYLIMTNAPGAESWPITATNFMLMHKDPKNLEGAKAAKEFFRWVYANGGESARQLGYVPLPASLVRQIETYWSQNMAY